MLIGETRTRGRLRSPFPPRAVCRTAAAAAFLLLSASLFGQQTWTPKKDVSYGKLTRDSLDALTASAAELREGDPAGATARLQNMAASVSELKSMADYFHLQADLAATRCTTSMTTVEDEVAAIADAEANAVRTIQELEAKIQGVRVKKNHSQTEFDKMSREVDKTLQAIGDDTVRVRGLDRFWQAFAVNDLIARINSLRITLAEQIAVRGSHLRDWQAADQELYALAQEQKTIQSTQKGLIRTRAQSEHGVSELRHTIVFLAQAESFWSQFADVLARTVERRIELIAKIDRALKANHDGPPLSYNWEAKPYTDLYTSLAAFGDSIDLNSNFLLGDGKDYCGGPARVGGPLNLSATCRSTDPFGNITTHPAGFIGNGQYRDPSTCVVDYRNFPGCPPRPKETVDSEAAVDAGRARGTWSRRRGHEPFSLSRCEDSSIYYGKVASTDACERKCMSDSACDAWAYKTSDWLIPNSRQDCWGGSDPRAPIVQGGYMGFDIGSVAKQ
jgi:hypothetical protein